MNNNEIINKLRDPLIRQSMKEKIRAIINNDIEEKEININIKLDKNFSAIYELVRSFLLLVLSNDEEVNKHIFYRGLLAGLEILYQYEELYKEIIGNKVNE